MSAGSRIDRIGPDGADVDRVSHHLTGREREVLDQEGHRNSGAELMVKDVHVGDELRRKIQSTRDESATMLRHNHQLLNQLEALTLQHYRVKSEVKVAYIEVDEND